MSLTEGGYEGFYSHLRSLNFHFLDTWVIECVNHYRSIKPNISSEELKIEVAQQWLLVNLREMKIPSLPPDLKSKDKIILNGKFAVQVESMLDSSQSYFSQFQKLRKIDTGDVEISEEPKEREIKSNRCLVLEVTDGVQELKAMEYHPIKKIKPNDSELLPGFKLVIIGPVECRKGMILLRDENVRICGGEVNVLTTTNNLKSILIKKLKLDEEDFIDCPDIEQENIRPSNDCVADLLSQNDEVFLSLPIETEMLVESQLGNVTTAHQYLNQNNASNKRRSSTLLHVENVSQQKKLHLDVEGEFEKEVEIKCSTPLTHTTHTELDIPMEIFIDDIIEPSKPKNSVQTTLSSFFRKHNKVPSKTSNHVNGEPFVYLKQILSLNFKNQRTFKIKAIILTLKKKITVEDDKFNLRATITDGSNLTDVDFSSSILEAILGFSPCEMVEMIKAKQKNSAIAQRVKESFSKAQDKLISLNCLMKIKIFPDKKVPMVVLLEEVTGEHLMCLKERSIKES